MGDIRGCGLFWAVEFVADKQSKTPLAPESDFSNTIVRNALGDGLDILGNLGHTDTYYIDHVIICLPYIVTEGDLKQIVSLLRDAIIETSRSFLDE